MVALGFGDSILPNLIEQGFVADLKKAGGLFAIPVGLLESLPDGFAFGFVLGAACQRLQSAARVRFTAGSEPPPPPLPSWRGCNSAAAKILVPQDQDSASGNYSIPASCPARNAFGTPPAMVARVEAEAAHTVPPCVLMKCFNRIGISSLRSRSGGSCKVNAFRR